MSLHALAREPAGEPEGALVLFHGRGADEHDLVPLLDVLDPERRLLGLTPRGPLSLPPGGAHWYVVPRVGYPDTETFHESYRLASEWLDALPVPLERTVLGGFSQGAVMSFALGLGSDRPRPAGIVAFSGFVPTVDGWEPDFAGAPPVAIGHGTYDPIIPVEFGRTRSGRARGRRRRRHLPRIAAAARDRPAVRSRARRVGRAAAAAGAGRALTISATAPRMTAPATSVRVVTASPRKTAPRSTATTGFTYAYVATSETCALRSSQA